MPVEKKSLLEPIPTGEASAGRYRENVSGDPRQVMWGPEDSQRTESMASGHGRTLSEQGQVCRLLKPCSQVLMIEVQHDGKTLACHKDSKPHERKAPPTPDVKHPKDKDDLLPQY